ncbi:MAG: Hsp70 family protein [Planctomycetes bacterium]|nr:Hsp70 family protein [Planctomycetota bacterium]
MDEILQPWLDNDVEPADLYQLLGVPRFHESLDDLGTAIREAHAVLRQYQRHPESEVQERSRRLRNLVGQAARVFASQISRQTYDAELKAKLAAMQQRRKYDIVGIDLGTTYSALAYIDVHGEPQVVANPDDQSNVTASVVYIDGDDIVVGATALRNAKSAPENVVQFAKRDMGEQNATYVRGDDRKAYTPESISAIILKKLVAYSEQEIGPIHRAVVTVPAYFNGLRRVATAQAGQIAGLEVVATLNEPSAACIAYRLHTNQHTGIYVVYDLGGGTFDVTVMRVGRNRIQELASDGNRQLGGYDWDRKLVDMVCRQFLEQHQLDPRTDPMAFQTLMNDCCEAKKTLSSLKKAHIRCTFQGKELRAEVTRDDFERETGGLLKKTELTIESCLRAAGGSWADLAGPDELDSHQRESLRKNGFRWDDISGIMLVGGSTRMPMVQSMVKRISGKEPMRNVDVDLAVAMGAAIYAGVLETQSSDVVFEELPTIVPLSDEPPRPAGSAPLPDPGRAGTFEYVTVNSLGIGVFVSRAGVPMNFVMIPPHTVLPAIKSHTFRTTQENACDVRVRISEGDSANSNQCHELGFCVVGPLPERLPRGSKIEIQIGFDKDGRVTVQGRCLTTNTIVRAIIDAAGLLTQEQVDRERRELDRRTIN